LTPSQNFTQKDGVTLREYIEYRLDELCRIAKKNQADIDSLQRTRDEAVGKASRSQYVAVLSLLVAVAALIMHILQLT
jgi:hypothetical protein